MSGRKGRRSRSTGAHARQQEVLRLGAQLLFPTREMGDSIHPLLAQRDLIVQAAARLLEGQASMWLADELFLLTTSPDVPAAQGELQLPAPAPSLPASPLMLCAHQSQQPCFAGPDGPEPLSPEAGEECGDCQILQVALPIVAEDPETRRPTVLGILQVERENPPGFDSGDLEILDGIGVQVGLALQSARQMAVERWRLQQLSLVRQVSARVANVRDLDELATQITRLILTTFNYYYVAIFTLEPGQDMLQLRRAAGPEERTGGTPAARPAPNIRVGQGLVGWVAQSGEEVIANDVTREPRYRYFDALPETRSEAAFPLTVEDRVLGVLDVQSDQVDDFHETDILVLRSLAGNIAQAVEGARLYTALSRRAEQIQAVYDVSNAITSILEEEALLTEVVHLIQRHFGYPYVHIFSVHHGRRKIFYEAGTGPRSQFFKDQQFAHDLDDPHGIIPWVARTGEMVVANDVEREPRYRPSSLPPENTRSELAVPLIFMGEVLGVLDVQSDRLNAFGEDDRFLFEALADNIAGAMRNAALYRSESWRREVAEGMHEIAGLLSADADLEQVLHAILEKLYNVLPCDVAAIWLLDEELSPEDLEIGGGESAFPVESSLRLAAYIGADLTGLGLEQGQSLEEVLPVLGLEAESAAEEILASWFLEALQSDRPVIRTGSAGFDPIGHALQFPSNYSAIAAPLRVSDQHLGVLVLAHRTSGRFGAEARLMTATFASYAAVAIENTRLYEAAHEQAWVSTVLLQVSEATQSLTNLAELLATVVRITPMLVGVKGCALYMLDEDGVFVPAAAYGFEPEQQIEVERWRFAPGDIPAFDRLVEEKAPIVLHSTEDDPLLASILQGSDPEQPGIAEWLVLAPLLARGEVLGAMLVGYSTGANDNIEELFEERLSILQGIAHQTATAVENIRLFKSQQEEAYVSVALLQVAQAVVSSSDLQETLGSIVRITPILVGVKRSLIFLWDPDYQVFRLAEGYGVSRTAEGEQFTPEEFPLLEAVRRWDSLVALPLPESSADVPDAWAQLPVPELDEIDELLERENCLLLAFPLSIKGNVLGALLVEEPEPLVQDVLTGSGGLRRLREKRLEITTGISQQAAMAIQNDLLQREMVERERLEREFQLAREIQRTFLPSEIPDLPGWDMAVRWRTAREVGGDFYDFFELPGGRLGLVIADVADKGMPAALFMTLVRTLVRAAVQETDSPGAVLERVNDILLPDARQGMFVTIVYAVLSLETGELRYANAGHNPPLIKRREDGPVELLHRGGMALGVMENTVIEERQIVLEPGDLLVLYTDGLTEAFAEDGRMFGLEGLQQAIEDANGPNGGDDGDSTTVLDAVERALSEFVGNHPRADDLTLLALRRLPERK